MSRAQTLPGGRLADSGERGPIAAVVHPLLRLGRSVPVAAAAVLIFTTIALAAIFAPVVAPYDPLEGDYGALRQGPSLSHPFGTDDLGRDVFSRIVYGARISLGVGVASVALGDLIGLAWGVTSGYIGRRFDLVSQRLLEVLLAFPALILATMLMMALGSGLVTVIIAIAITRVPAATRVTRSVVLSLKEIDYVEAARVVGGSPWRIMVQHITPQTIAPFMVVVSAHLGIAITTEAALSFLGVGIPPPAPSWGTMLGGVTSTRFNPLWWLALFPGLAITITVLTANLTGDALRDLFDPKLRGRLRET